QQRCRRPVRGARRRRLRDVPTHRAGRIPVPAPPGQPAVRVRGPARAAGPADGGGHRAGRAGVGARGLPAAAAPAGAAGGGRGRRERGGPIALPLLPLRRMLPAGAATDGWSDLGPLLRKLTRAEVLARNAWLLARDLMDQPDERVLPGELLETITHCCAIFSL